MPEFQPPPGAAPAETPSQTHALAAPPETAPETAIEAAPETAIETAIEAAATPAPAAAGLSPAACAAALAERFPALFGRSAQPLKLRIQADIQQRAPGVFSKKALSGFLHRYTTTTAYLLALTRAAQRLDLDGAPAGEINPEHRQAAADELLRRRGVHEARRAAEQAARRDTEHAARAAHHAAEQAEQAARRVAEAQTRHQHAAQDQARRDRAALLRAFDSSTLTRANFCALKGLPEAELDHLLATARQEAAERAQVPRPEHPAAGRRHGRHGRPDSR